MKLEYDFHVLSLEIEEHFVLTVSSMKMFEKLNIPFQIV
jgi:hypothetical protein